MDTMTPEMMSAAEKLASLPFEDREKILKEMDEGQAFDLLYDWTGFNARPDQIPPEGDWDIWCILSGRGWGKTRTGAEFIKNEIDAKRAGRVAIVAETAADARDTIVEGDSGIMSIYPRNARPTYEPTKRRLTWSTGAIATLYNATEPDQLRGPQHDLGWSDELAKWRYARATWDQLQFGLRIGKRPRQIVTTTPRPIELVKAIVGGQEGKVHLTRGRTLDNKMNLAPSFLRKVVARYEGTRLGRQELSGEILGDLPGALWRMDQIEVFRKDAPEKYVRIVVAVDHAVTDEEGSNEHGVIVVGLGEDNRGYVIEDSSCSGSPLDWARRAIAMMDKYTADSIVLEINQGGDMVESTLRSVRPDVNAVLVRAAKGKQIRAEPIAALYEQGRVSHVGFFPQLEEQMCQMTTLGYEGEGSPDRVDAMVWGFTELFPSMVEPIDSQGKKIRYRKVTVV